MKSQQLNEEELLSLNEDNLIIMLTPGRMGGDDYILVYKLENEFVEYYIDRSFYDKINSVFPKRKISLDNPDYYEKIYYEDDNYFETDMGMGCRIFIKNEYALNFILNAKKILEQQLKRELRIEEVLCSESYLCGCWREATEMMLEK